MILLIDDVRNVDADVICRNAAIAMDIICSQNWDVIIFDHDLGHDHMDGYKLLEGYLEYFDCEAVIKLITANPVGLQKMRDLLRNYNYTSKDGGFTFEYKEQY